MTTVPALIVLALALAAYGTFVGYHAMCDLTDRTARASTVLMVTGVVLLLTVHWTSTVGPVTVLVDRLTLISSVVFGMVSPAGRRLRATRYRVGRHRYRR